MKRLLLITLLLCTAVASAGEPVKVTNLARDFVTFWDATQDMAENERVAAFHRDVGSKFPAFYGLQRFGPKATATERDRHIASVIAGFGKWRQAYLAKIGQFDAELPRHMATFSRAFPDFQLPVPLYLLHSLGEMDGGPRELEGKHYLIFGADMMTALHGNGNEAAFFHHELFHIHHNVRAPECEGQGMWQPLWREGLATYVSQALNPDATESEMLLTFPEGSLPKVKATLYASLAHLETVLDNSDDALYGPLFSTRRDNTGLAPRRGYYLGYLVAREIGKTRDLQTLASLDCQQARQLVVDTVHKLKQAAQSASN
ncbi:hypothetical protein GCM10027277_30240 [Pseudoduganella ginsengisoli]|uniref:DUF2268 domain-containing protein n=1 Tax=Pseudoduganella ginsengisoli TaxID=1462440 RepID=A0A6L6PYU3_9BURK|nr:hypothetical protein [Pseudoduganella ginsengisoli]MTW02436.1 hypothetical protein [Pseudoduganella ginsengisoli]